MKAAVLFSLLLLPATMSAQSGLGAKRLTGQALYITGPGGYQLTDSAHYTYSAQRGSRFDPNYLQYNVLPVMGSTPNYDFVNLWLPTHNIDSSNLPRADFDTAFFALSINAAPPNTFQQREGHRYGTAGEITDVYNRVFDPVSGVQRYGQQSIQTYTGGRLTRSYILSFDGAVYDTTFVRDFAYNSAGQLILDSLSYRLTTASYQAYRKMLYSYAGSGGYTSVTAYSFRPTPSRLEPSYRDSLSYYPDGRLKRRKWFYPGTSGNFLPNYIDSFGYTAGVAGFTTLLEQETDTLGNPLYTYYTVASGITPRGQKDSVTRSSFRGSTSLGVDRVGIVYDTAGYPLSRSDYYSSTGPTPYSVEYYYYEPVPQPGVGVPRYKAAPELTLAPNPCRESLSYTLTGIAPGTAICVDVLNLSGQLVHRELRTWNGGSQKLVLSSEAPAGHYILRLSDLSGGTHSSRQFTRL